MSDNKDEVRARVGDIARAHIERGDWQGWFEALYADAQGDDRRIPWADLRANPNLVTWLDRQPADGGDQPALVIGCGLGDDAEALAARGYAVTAFDIAPSAIEWAQRRFPNSDVRYLTADLFALPEVFSGAFRLIVEAYTFQSMPAHLRPDAMRAAVRCLAPSGRLLVIARGRDDDAPPAAAPPFPLSRADLAPLTEAGLRVVWFEDYIDHADNNERRFRVEYAHDEQAQ